MVYWPELATFDDLALRAEGVARSQDSGAIESLRPRLIEAGRAVSAETIPHNVTDRPRVESILADIANLVDRLDASPEMAATVVPGIHPATARLMAAAGMPHVHANEGPNRGALHPVFGADGAQVGTAELLLDAETGELQTWLSLGGRGGEPWQLPADTTLTLAFPLLGHSITLKAGDQPEDDRIATTFVFPADGESGAPWLVGPEFEAAAELRFDDKTTASFVLRPHGH